MRNLYPGYRGDSRFFFGGPFLGGLLGGLVGSAIFAPRPFYPPPYPAFQPYPAYPPYQPYPFSPYGGVPY
ncbi:hypothetical protein [Mesobacillus zeae]